ncbi:hypothetical protein CcaverHIS002_0602170 [Cutaneotrichosporon cavernicola]|nr:hypothetical protein CcaverHIS002_0602170 [Cutaneotrichosporon cavernicola]BEJ01485.1 hypothetical protein CcaverHIS631_0601670 [Cutaneotrichosporon cavernicola]
MFFVFILTIALASARWVNDLCPPGPITPSLPPGMADADGPLHFIVVARGKAIQCGAQTWARANAYDVGCILSVPPFYGAVAPNISRLAMETITYPQIGAIPQLALEVVENGNQLTVTDPATDLFVTLNVSARIAPPRVNRDYDIHWTSYNAVAGDFDFGTEVLRIYTAGGVPRRCRDNRPPEEVDYAALYWFYK